MRLSLSALFAVGLSGLAGAQTPLEFDILPPQSLFHWTGTTDQGQLVPTSTQNFIFVGTLKATLERDSQGLDVGRFEGMTALITPDIDALIGGAPRAPFSIKNAQLSISSQSFPIAADGTFATTLDVQFLSGTMTIDPPAGALSVEPLVGDALQPSPVQGRVTQTGSTYRVELSPTFVFNIASGGVLGTLTMTGDIVAELDCAPAGSFCGTTPNSAGAGARIGWGGSTGVFADDLSLTASGVPAFQPGIFFYGPTEVQIPLGNGVLCVGPPHVRLAPVPASAGGAVLQALSIATLPTPITAGESWSFQFWYRDPSAGGAFYNLSDALEIRFCP